MYTVPFVYLFIIYITVWLTLVCVLFDFYWIYIKICGESVPSQPDRTEKIYKEPGGPYQIGKVLRALFSLRKVYSRGLHETTKKEMSKWQKEVCIMPADLQSESERIHSLESKPKKWIKPDSLAYRDQTRPVWSRCPASHTDTSSKWKPPFGTFPGLCGGVSRTT